MAEDTYITAGDHNCPIVMNGVDENIAIEKASAYESLFVMIFIN